MTSISSLNLAITHGEPLSNKNNLPKTLPDALKRAATSSPDKGVIYIQSDDSDAFQSYPDLLKEAQKILAGLRKQGLKPQDKVIFQLPDNQDFIATFWSCLLGGFVPVPMEVPATYQKENSAVKKLHNVWQMLDKPLVVVSKEIELEIINSFKTANLTNFKIETCNSLKNNEPDYHWHNSEPEDLTLLLLTSGSTGTPKGVQLSHRVIIYRAAIAAQRHQTHRDTVSINWLPLDHVSGIAQFHVRDIYSGCQQIHAPTDMFLQDPVKWLDWIDRYKVNISWSPNFAYGLVNNHKKRILNGNWDLSSMQIFLNAGEAIAPQTARRFMELLIPHGLPETAMHPAWGMSETAGAVVYSDRYSLKNNSEPRTLSEGVPQGDTASHISFRANSELERSDIGQFVETGTPAPDLSIRIVDGENKVVKEEVIGTLQIKGEMVTSGYYQNPEANEAAFTDDGWFNTGDVAFIREGRLTIAGRRKDVIIINGLNYYCHEIEAVVEDIAGVEVSYTAACGFRPADSDTDKLVIFFHPQDNGNLSELIDRIRSTVVKNIGINPTYLIPVAKETIPKTGIGKIQRSQIKQSLEAGEFEDIIQAIPTNKDIKKEFVAPRNDLERQVSKIWQEVLEKPKIGIHDNFFELGGHSILAAQVISRSRQTFKVEIPLQSLFETSTIASFAQTLIGIDIVAESPITPRENQTNSIPLSYTQEGLWFLSQLEPDNPFYNLSATVSLRGNLNVAALDQSLQEIVQRHEILRTNITVINDQPVQVIKANSTVTLSTIDLKADLPSSQSVEVTKVSAEICQQPFNLEKDSLVRFTLLELAEDNHVLLITIHHIISDGYSWGVLIQEIGELYQAYSQKTAPSLPQLPIQYGDYALWQRKQLEGEKLEKLVKYWKHQLVGIPALLDLPSDRTRPARQSFRGSTKSSYLSPQLTKKLQQLSQTANTTLFMTLEAAFAVLMYRYSGQSDIVIGSPIANRHRAELEGLSGFLANNLVLRNQFKAAITFEDLLVQVQKTTLEAYEHQELPFGKMVDEVQPERDLSRNPLFQVMFALQYTSLPSLELEHLNLSPVVNFNSETARFDLEVHFWEDGEGLKGDWLYSTDLFDGSTIERMIQHFEVLLEGIVTNPNQPVSQLPLITAAEQELLLEVWNDTQLEYPGNQCIHQLFEAQVERTPNAVALKFETKELTYTQLNQKANQLAHYLRTLGVKPEVLVGICVERSVEMIVGLLAILKAGGAYIPLDPTYPNERIAYMLEDSNLSILLTQEKLKASLPDNQANVIGLDGEWESIAKYPDTNPLSEVTTSNLAYVIYTSGSTGKPKGVLLEHRGLTNFLTSMMQQPGLSESDKLVAVTTIAFDIAALELYLPLIVGAELILVSREVASDAPQLWLTIIEKQATVMQATPATWQMLLSVGWQYKKPLKILCGGEALPQELAQELLATGASLWNLYGPTETTIWSAVKQIESDAYIDIGRPLANTQMYILDEQLQPVPIGVAGELYIGGDGLARGYLHRDDLTQARFISKAILPQSWGDRIYKTGDLARYQSDGNIELIGRIDNQVKIRGFRIELGEIEFALAQHPEIKQSVVIVREDIPGDRQLVAYVVTQQNQTLTNTEMRRFLPQTLPNYMIPGAFILLEQLPLTPNGKINRRALPAPKGSQPEQSNTFIAPNTLTEKHLAAIWSEVLRIEKIGIKDNFFELGGHSLLATQVISRLRQSLSAELIIRHIFELPTIEELAQKIETEKTNVVDSPAIQPVTRDRNLPLSFAQQRLWFLAQLEPDSSAYNMPTAYRLTGRLNVEILEQSITTIIDRHESLRTNFLVIDEQPTQVITKDVYWQLTTVNLEHLTPDEAEVRVEQLANKQAQQPFDLTQDLLIRAQIVCLQEEEHILLVTIHHIVSDEWSNHVFLSELITLYQALVVGEESPLSSLPIQYADFAIWQRQRLQKEGLELELHYWKQKLGGNLPVLELPTDYPRPKIQTYNGANIFLELPTNLNQGIKSLSQKSGVTTFMTLLTTFTILMHRYSSQDDIIVGSPMAGRNRIETEGLIGFFVNTLALRTQFSDNQSFSELLGQVRQTVLEADKHQNLPFEKIVEELQPERDTSRSPLFQVMFVLQNGQTQASDLESLNLSINPVDIGKNATAKFDLTLFMFETAEGLKGIWEYNTDLFAAETITRMVGHFQTLLEGIIANPDQKINELPLITAAEKEQLLVQWNNTQADYPEYPYVHQLVETQAEQTPNAVAVRFEEQELTYRELNQKANQLAHYLQTLGVQTGNKVGICLERSFEMIIALLAILKTVGAYIPFDPAYPTERLAYLLEDSQVKLLLSEEDLRLKLPDSQAQIIYLEQAEKEIAQQKSGNLSLIPQTENLAYVIYTSGSTGKPKGVLVTHSALLNLVFWHQKAFAITASDRATQLAGMAFDAAVWEIWPYLTAGASISLIDPETLLSPEKLQDWLIKQKITVSFVPTPLAERLLCLEWSDNISLRIMLTGGDKLHSSPANFIPFKLVNNYGPTENTVVTTSGIIVAKPGKTPTIGCSIANTQVYILDRHLQPVPIGVPGELYIGGRQLAKGYLNRPELTRERFIPNTVGDKSESPLLYKTGDVAKYLRDGNIEYIGRIDNQVKIRGFRIELGEIEAALAQYPKIEQSVVIAREDIPGDKRLTAYLVVKQNESPSSEQIRDFLQETLPSYMIPGALIILEQMPLTPNGKIDRLALPQPKEISRELEANYVIPKTEAEAKIVAIWQEVLKIEKIGIHNNFFDLGGHSLLVAQVHNKLRDIFATQISLVEMFTYSTIHSLAQRLTTEFNSESRSQPTSNRASNRKTRQDKMNQQRQNRRLHRSTNQN